MLKLRLREYTPMGVKGKVLPVIEGTLEVTTQLNSTPRLTFSMSTIMAGKMPVDGFVVGVEYAVGNGHYQPLPQHDRFIITEDDKDNADPSKVISYTGESYAIWLLAHTYVHWNSNAVNKQRKVSSNAGGTMRYFLLESKDRGWGNQFTYDFDGNKDSNGVNWIAGTDNTAVDWNLLTPLTEVLDQLHEGGLCDWSVEGTKLRLFRPETLGTDKTEKVLGKTAQRAPAKTDMSEIFTNLTVVPEKAYYWLYLDNPAAPSKYGRLEATMTQSGIESHAEATKLAQPSLLKGRTVAREESFEYNARNNDLIPWKDFSIGDRLTIISGGERAARRVIGIVAKSENGTTSVRTIVGDPITSTMKKVLKRVGAASVGDIVGGSGSTFPGNFGPAPLTPEKPDNLRLVSNDPVWLEDGTAMTTIKIAWDAVTKAVDGSTAIIEEYEVWSRTGGEFPTRDTAVINPEAVITHWEPGTVRYVTVRARNNLGHWSEHSLELAVTPDYPTSIVPKAPTGLTVVSNVGAFTAYDSVATVVLKWDAVMQSTDNTPIEIEEYEVLVNEEPLFRVERLTTTVSLATGIVGKYRVRAKSSIGFWGDPSTEVTVTGASPVVQSGKNPTGVTGRTGFGVVVTEWAGTYASAPATNSVLNVRVEARVGTSGAWVMQGTLSAAGSVTLQLGAVGDTVQSRLVAYDRLGRVIGTSDTVSVVVQGVSVTDVSAAFASELAEFRDYSTAITLAEGKLTLSAKKPLPADGVGKPTGALWMVKVGGSFTEMSEWTGSAWEARPLDEQIIPKVAIGAGTYGELDGTRLMARTILADKVAIGSTKNEVWDGEYTSWNTSAWGNTLAGGPGSAWTTEVVRPGMFVSQKLTEKTAPASIASMYSAMRAGVSISTGTNVDRLVYVGDRVGEKLVAYSHWLVSQTPPNGLSQISTRVYFYNAAGSNFSNQSGGNLMRVDVVPGEWVRVGGTQVTVPAGALYAVVRPTVYYTNNTTEVNGTVYYLGGEEMYWANAGELIVDGAVKARHVEMETGFFDKLFGNTASIGRVNVDHVEPAFGSNLNLSANGDIILHAGRLDRLGDELADTTAVAHNAQANATTATTAAAAAAAAAAIADGKALVAQAGVQTVSDGLATQTAVFVVTPTGAEVRSADASNVFSITPAGAAIVQGGSAVSTWDGARFISNEIVTNRAQLANHTIAKAGTRTVFRAL